MPYDVKLPLTIRPRIPISEVIKISSIAKANPTQVIEYFDVYSQYNPLKCASIYMYRKTLETTNKAKNKGYNKLHSCSLTTYQQMWKREILNRFFWHLKWYAISIHFHRQNVNDSLGNTECCLILKTVNCCIEHWQKHRRWLVLWLACSAISEPWRVLQYVHERVSDVSHLPAVNYWVQWWVKKKESLWEKGKSRYGNT